MIKRLVCSFCMLWGVLFAYDFEYRYETGGYYKVSNLDEFLAKLDKAAYNNYYLNGLHKEKKLTPLQESEFKEAGKHLYGIICTFVFTGNDSVCEGETKGTSNCRQYINEGDEWINDHLTEPLNAVDSLYARMLKQGYQAQADVTEDMAKGSIPDVQQMLSEIKVFTGQYSQALLEGFDAGYVEARSINMLTDIGFMIE